MTDKQSRNRSDVVRTNTVQRIMQRSETATRMKESDEKNNSGRRPSPAMTALSQMDQKWTTQKTVK